MANPRALETASTLAAEALLEGSLDKICKRVEEEALNGNMQAAKMILERFLPPLNVRQNVEQRKIKTPRKATRIKKIRILQQQR
ncbi:MAG: hypothetical protein ACM3JI_02940 [Anaerolineae bacterium]